MHKCGRCGATCDCGHEGAELLGSLSECWHECEPWTGVQLADPLLPLVEGSENAGDFTPEQQLDRLAASFGIPPDLLRADLEKVAFDPVTNARLRWQCGEFTDTERATLERFSAEHLDGQPWQEVLDAQAIVDLLEAAGVRSLAAGLRSLAPVGFYRERCEECIGSGCELCGGKGYALRHNAEPEASE